MNTIRVGVVGAGNWAVNGHLPVLGLLPQFEVAAVQSRRREASDAAAAKFGIGRVADSVDELLALPEIDLVLVTTTAPQHAETVRAAIAAGKHVYSEWPLTTGSEIADDLVAAAEAAGVRHFAGLQRGLAPHNLHLRDLVAEGYVGDIRSVRMHVSMNYLQAHRPPSLRWTAAPENFSSVAAIYGGHFLDMLFKAVGRPRSLSGLLVNQFPEITIDGSGEVIRTTAPDQLLLTGRLAGTGVLSVQVEGGKRNGSGVQIDITGTEGDLRITNTSAFGGVGENYLIEGARGDNLPLRTLELPEGYDTLGSPELPSSVRELAYLYRAVATDLRTGTSTAPTFADAAGLHHLFDSLEASNERDLTLV
jgi:predicted dehydrogenase